MKITIIGAQGFIGSNLAQHLIKLSYEVLALGRNDTPQSQQDYGTIIYCAGIKSDFKTKVADLIQAHISSLTNWLTHAEYNQFIYLSSARIYSEQKSGQEDTENFLINRYDLYNQSKILGEAICTALDENAIILRPTNVIGFEPNSTVFLWQLLRQAKESQSLHLTESADTARDYIPLAFLLDNIEQLLRKNLHGIYNVSAGKLISNSELCHTIQQLTPIQNITYGEKKVNFPIISNEKLLQQTQLVPPCALEAISSVFNL